MDSRKDAFSKGPGASGSTAPGPGKTVQSDKSAGSGNGKPWKKTRRKHRGGSKRKYKPYMKLSWDERLALEAREEKRAEQSRKQRFNQGVPVAPYNTTQFLLEDRQARTVQDEDVDKIVDQMLHRNLHKNHDAAASAIDPGDIEGADKVCHSRKSNLAEGGMGRKSEIGRAAFLCGAKDSSAVFSDSNPRSISAKDFSCGDAGSVGGGRDGPVAGGDGKRRGSVGSLVGSIVASRIGTLSNPKATLLAGGVGELGTATTAGDTSPPGVAYGEASMSNSLSGGGSDSSTDMDYLDREFDNEFESANAERVESMSKDALVRECLDLERRLEAVQAQLVQARQHAVEIEAENRNYQMELRQVRLRASVGDCRLLPSVRRRCISEMVDMPGRGLRSRSEEPGESPPM